MSNEIDLVDAFLEHHGVKGMRWGVRKKYSELRSQPLETLNLKTANGISVTLQEEKIPVIGAAIGSISKRIRDHLNSGRSFSIIVDGKNVGETSFKETSKTELNLVWLGVRPKHRGQGYASTVFGAGVAYAKEKGYSRLTLEVPGNAPDARHIYEKFGFKETGKTFSNPDADYMFGGLTELAYDLPKKVSA